MKTNNNQRLRLTVSRLTDMGDLQEKLKIPATKLNAHLAQDLRGAERGILQELEEL
jgi:hypothetical protein